MKRGLVIVFCLLALLITGCAQEQDQNTEVALGQEVQEIEQEPIQEPLLSEEEREFARIIAKVNCIGYEERRTEFSYEDYLAEVEAIQSSGETLSLEEVEALQAKYGDLIQNADDEESRNTRDQQNEELFNTILDNAGYTQEAYINKSNMFSENQTLITEVLAQQAELCPSVELTRDNEGQPDNVPVNEPPPFPEEIEAETA